MSYSKDKPANDGTASMDPLLLECISILERYAHEIHCIYLVVVTLQANQKSWNKSHRSTKGEVRKNRKERRLEEENPAPCGSYIKLCSKTASLGTPFGYVLKRKRSLKEKLRTRRRFCFQFNVAVSIKKIKIYCVASTKMYHCPTTTRV